MKIQFQRTASPVAIEIRTASAKPLKPGPFYFGLFLAAAALLSPGWGVQRGAAQLFPNAAGDEPSYSIGVFQLTVDPAFAVPVRAEFQHLLLSRLQPEQRGFDQPDDV